MIVDVPVREIIEKYGEERTGMWDLTLRRALQDYGFQSAQFDSNNLPPVGDFIVSVPSLNVPGGFHAIVIQMDYPNWSVIDPQAFREGKKYYISGQSKDPNAFQINVWEKPLMCWKSWA